ncbi:MAG: H4MPT-linked C1 transfer pathway protein [Bradyrhizobiaceae bacterium]|nr:H4MPT-linked C1 transfer pathway protein [Hyphomicrobiales bacterium]MBV9426581.1 H4MPT-linked C1 transfer pathway protein [Bradyrhizobiaceae bacterium]
MRTAVGWDIGGVHLKAARAQDGRVVDAVQIASPLRLGVGALVDAFAQAAARMGSADCHAVTMTGELADTFESRARGVETLAALAAREVAGAPVMIYAGPLGLIPPERAGAHVREVASANWHATASLVGVACRAALFADMGSTTTDLVPVINATVAARAYTDVERLAAGELVYTGLVRTPLMAVARRAPWNGRMTPLINENFATMADVYRVLGRLPEGVDQMASVDGRAKTKEASRARLARMIGCDAADGGEAAWTALACWFAEAQTCAVFEAAMLVLSQHSLPGEAPIVGCGIGETVLREVARRLGRTYVGFDTLISVEPAARAAALQCAPAAALAAIFSKG